MNVERALYDDPDAPEKARKRALADIAAGRVVAHDEVADWLKSWGRADEKPIPPQWLE